MDAEQVARYLADNPLFFEQHAQLLSGITVPHPHGGHSIPLAERQVLALRERAKALEAKLAELIQFGEENDAINEKMHRLALALLAAPSLDTLIAATHYHLREDFQVPHTAMRVWMAPPGAADAGEFAPVSHELKQYAAGLTHPFCGPSSIPEAAGWFGEAAAHVRSVAFMPLAEPGPGGTRGACVGMLAMGSEDALRFYPEMGTVYLQRLGEMVSAALARLL
jgi:uncharacterized protein YigA (DUF484 family)